MVKAAEWTSANKSWAVALLISLLAMVGCGGGAGPVRQVDIEGGYLPLIVSVTNSDGWDVSLTSTVQLAEVKFFFANGTSETFPLSGLSAAIHSDCASEWCVRCLDPVSRRVSVANPNESCHGSV